MIYFDNAATSFPKPKCVIREVTKCITQYCGNPGRGSYPAAMEAVERFGPVYGSYLAAKRLIRCNPFAKGGYDPVPGEVDTTIRKDEN